MKKTLTAVICVCIVILMLFGCGKKETANGSPDVTPDKAASGEVNQPSETDGDDDSDMRKTSGVGLGAAYESKYYYETYILKDVKTELYIPDCPEIQEGEELHVSEVYKSVSADVLKERYEKFASNLDVETEPIITEASDEVYQVSFPTGKGEVTGSIWDSMDGIATVVGAGASGFSIGYICDNISEKRTDVEAMNEYFSENPFVKAACAYGGITEPVLMKSIEYNIYGVPQLNYYICEAGADAYTSVQNVVDIYITDTNDVSILFKAHEPFENDKLYPAISADDAVKAFYEESGVKPDDIYKIGFSYVQLQEDLYVPCYMVVCPGDNEFAKMNNMDLSVYQEWAIFAVPAVDIQIEYYK